MEEGLEEQSNSKNQVSGQYIRLKDFVGERSELWDMAKWVGVLLNLERKYHAFGEIILFF